MGIISGFNGSSPREVLMTKEEWRQAIGYVNYNRYEDIIKKLDNIKI